MRQIELNGLTDYLLSASINMAPFYSRWQQWMCPMRVILPQSFPLGFINEFSMNTVQHISSLLNFDFSFWKYL